MVELKKMVKVAEGKILTWNVKKEIPLRPLVSFQRVKVKPPTLEDQKSDLEEEVIDVITTFAPFYIFSPAHNIQADVPP